MKNPERVNLSLNPQVNVLFLSGIMPKCSVLTCIVSSEGSSSGDGEPRQKWDEGVAGSSAFPMMA